VFVSILLHELGHVVAGKLFGSHGRILLYSFGGLALGASNLAERWQRITVYLAGPASQLLLLIVVAIPYKVYTGLSQGEGGGFLGELFFFLFIINGFWALLNLLPVWPLDGGQVSREFFELVNPAGGRRASLILSLVCAAVLAVAGLLFSVYTALLFGSLAYCSWQLLQVTAGQPRLGPSTK
jgi:Zn-dependent protease